MSRKPPAHWPSARNSLAAGSAQAGRVREPEKLTCAPCTPMITSADATSEAQTPPVVGSPATAMCGIPARRALAMAPATTCIWTSALEPSCIRMPPDWATETTGRPRPTARSKAAAILAPSASPIEPPRKENSKPTSTHCSPPTVATPVVTACGTPAAARARRSWPGYPGQPAGSTASIWPPKRARLPASAIAAYSAGPGGRPSQPPPLSARWPGLRAVSPSPAAAPPGTLSAAVPAMAGRSAVIGMIGRGACSASHF